MKVSSAAILLAITAPAMAAEPQKAFNNLAHEYAICAAYFGVVSIAIENSSDPETAAQYKTLMDNALAYAATTGEAIGLLPETTGARFETAIKEMQDRIGGNTSNISILFADHLEPCLAAMEDPGGRIAHWMAQ